MSVKEKPRTKSFSLYKVSFSETAIEQQRLGNKRTLPPPEPPPRPATISHFHGGLSADGTSKFLLARNSLYL